MKKKTITYHTPWQAALSPLEAAKYHNWLFAELRERFPAYEIKVDWLSPERDSGWKFATDADPEVYHEIADRLAGLWEAYNGSTRRKAVFNGPHFDGPECEEIHARIWLHDEPVDHTPPLDSDYIDVRLSEATIIGLHKRCAILLNALPAASLFKPLAKDAGQA